MSEKEQYREFYETAEKIVGEHISVFQDKIVSVKDPNERGFLEAVGTYFLQQRQAEVIRNEKY
ncbi:MAG: hypothetical protein LBM87_05910 [Ruminococcus sp.]|jgi:hypothetical protein|nr:hypothetical protein [Ruminococcus sp.]